MLFYLDKTNTGSLTPLDGTTLERIGWLEKDLENLVAQHIDRVVRESQLLVIAQERKYQEEPDILALDREGRLHIFELKRWRSNQENLLQVLRYGQKFGQYDHAALNHLFHGYLQRVGQLPVGSAPPDLAKRHADYFDLEAPLERSRFNREQRFIVMTNGLDRGTREAIAYWSGKGLPVRPLVYRVYQAKGGDLLFEVEPYGPEGDAVEDPEEGLVVVNTNATYMPQAFAQMLKDGKASAFFDRKSAVDGIAKGSPIALYHTGVGFIALGKTTSDVRHAPSGSDPDGEHYVLCEFEYVVDPASAPGKAVSASKLNAHLQSSHRFRQTVYTLPAKAITFIRQEMKSAGAAKSYP